MGTFKYMIGLLAPLRRDQASPQDSNLIQSYFYYVLAPIPSTRSSFSLP
jgi:hypothetical protein